MKLRQSTKTHDWPETGIERLDLETFFAHGEPFFGPIGQEVPVLPRDWTLARAEAVWRHAGAECEREPGPDWWAWQEWGHPGGGA